mmetsp:Transcript_1743/g.3433  ORF Transcript_1743/g.3433 Transcript_1743/m.3433 type:complete len:284 (+) Transcript_1743:84-935(+)|eukprot:CAMPEP_0119070992 /NCGR_PEP_ID=MMETSP1178-20130426/46627_1 /TAXON_ID=33656 /ORGANISM="unid sp, Strain CCMP2000" /LENGTH=283 /DNA_ID=CAMNT_0007052877 /DNA_START=61 /DNA_END=912 /DNA_ORIENTATION=+
MRRNLGDARIAYSTAAQNEAVARQLSQAAHSIMASQPKGALASAGWSEGGHYEETTHLAAKLMLRGGVEGLMASLSVLALANGAGWPSSFSVPVSLVLVGCWAVCAACREGLESVTYSAHYARERSREAWELANFPEGEVAEMVQLYTKKGLPEVKARQVIKTMASATEFFVDVMMLEELQMAPPPELSALQAAAKVGSGVLVCGWMLPLCYALFCLSRPGPAVFPLALGVAAAGLAYLGVLRASITHQDRRKLGLQTSALVLPCCALPHLAGAYLSSLAVSL